jgi:hypothetical protein
MPLTKDALAAWRKNPETRKLFDERGLYALNDSGNFGWRLRYRFEGREKTISLGPLEDVPLKRAREKRDEARRLLADGIDPSAKRQAERHAAANTFRAIAEEWLESQRDLDPGTVVARSSRRTCWRNCVESSSRVITTRHTGPGRSRAGYSGTPSRRAGRSATLRPISSAH